MAPPHLAGPAVFEVGGRVARRGDVRSCGDLRGAFAAHARAFASGEAALRRAEPGAALAEADVERRVAELRYDRRLVAAEEARAWLSRHALEYGDLEAYVRRMAAVDTSDGERSDPCPVGESDFPEPAYTAHLVISGALAREADRLAARLAALVDEGGAALDGNDLPGASSRAEAAFARRCAERLTREERERRLRLARLDLTRVDLEILDVRDEDAAREAVLCLRDDGTAMDALAAETASPYVRTRTFLEDVGEDLRRALLSAATGSIVEPFAGDGCVRVARVLGKTDPDLADADVLARVDQALVEAIEADLVSRHVRWRLRDEAVA